MNLIRKLGCGGIAVAMLYSSGASAAERIIEEVLVTGSYIKGSPEDAPSPIQVITREDIDVQSAITIDDITKNLTINSGTTTNTNFDSENDTITGKGNVNLRGLGLNSTLVLFNGKRQVVAAAETQDGSEFVDINTIPLVMLDRVEILKDGGSALYGSDAIAGVVNFILRDDFEGLQVAADLTHNDRSSAQDVTFSALWGMSFNEGRTNFVIGGEYFDRDEYSFLDLGLNDATDRTTSANSTLNVIIPNTNFAFTGAGQLNPAYINAEASAITGGVEFTDPLCEQQGYFTGLFSDPVDDPNVNCREDSRQYRAVQVEQDRVSFMATMTHAFNDNIELYGMVQYNDQDVVRPVSGSFGAIDSFGAILPPSDVLWGLGSRAPSVIAARDAAFFATLGATGDVALATGAGTFAAIGAMPAPANAPILESNGGPGALTYMGYVLDKRGTYAFHGDSSDSESETLGGHIGLRGDFRALDRNMTFDISVGYSENETYRENLTVNRTALELAENGLGGPNCVPNGVDDYDLATDPGDLFGGGIFGNNGVLNFTFSNPAPDYVLNMRKNISLALTSTNQGVGDCMFINPFLTKETTLPNDPELLAHIYRVVPLEDRKNELTTIDLVLTSELWEMGGDVAQGAIGYQRRDQNNEGKSYPMVNPGVQDFLTYGADPTFLPVSDDHFYGSFTKDFDDDRDIDAFFAELNLPFSPNLEMQIAVRYEDYGGEIGDKTTPKVGIRWQAMDSLALRSSFSQSFRAPNTGVLFKGVGFDGQAAIDPLAKADVRAGLLPISEENSEVVLLIQNGAPSPLLQPEEADSWNFGLIFTPLGIEGLTVAVDYYIFEFEDKVVNEPVDVRIAEEQANFEVAAADPNNYISSLTFLPCVQGSSNTCIVDPNTYATPGVQRSPQGVLQVVDFFSVNAGSIDTSGIDLDVTYTAATDIGLWTFNLNWNHILEFEPDDIPGFEDGILGTGVKDCAGTTGDGSICRSMPENKANFVANFSRGNHMATAIVRYIDGYDNISARVFNSGSNPPKTVFDEDIDSWTTLDIQYNYRWFWGDGNPLSMTLGIVNAFDEDPPDRDDFAQGFDSVTVDPRGRRYYLRMLQTF